MTELYAGSFLDRTADALQSMVEVGRCGRIVTTDSHGTESNWLLSPEIVRRVIRALRCEDECRSASEFLVEQCDIGDEIDLSELVVAILKTQRADKFVCLTTMDREGEKRHWALDQEQSSWVVEALVEKGLSDGE